MPRRVTKSDRALARQMLPRALRDSPVRSAEYKPGRDEYTIQVETAPGLLTELQVIDPEQGAWFRVDANLALNLARVFRRGSGLAPKRDLWVLLALWSLSEKLQRTQVRAVDGPSSAVRALQMTFHPTQLLRELRVVRSRNRTGPLNDYSASDWRWVRTSLLRLVDVTVALEYTKRGSDRVRTTKSTLVSVDVPGNLRGEKAGARDPVVVTLNFYAGVEGTDGYFFVKLARALFFHRGGLGELESRLVVWLARQHRGTTAKPGCGSITHRWKVWIDLDELVSRLHLRPGHPGEGRTRLVEALRSLESSWIIEDLRYDEGRPGFAEVELSTMFFHDAGVGS